MKYFVIVKYLDKSSQQRWVQFDSELSAREYAAVKNQLGYIESARLAKEIS